MFTPLEQHSEKHVLAIVMPDLSESGKARKDSMVAHGKCIATDRFTYTALKYN
jgi:hypothetical protein